MKAIKTLALMFIATIITFNVNAQAAKTTTKAETKTTVEKKKESTAPAKAETKTAAKPAAEKKTNANGTVLKKDGTPDKRYKDAPKSTGPMKKDGTPDKRYKENKKAEPTKK